MYLTIAFLPLLIGLCARVTHPELMSGDTQKLLPVFVLQQSPEIIQVLFFGAILSAIMSSASAGILAPATVLGENIIKPLLNGLNDKKLLMVIRGCVVFVALASTGLACMKSNIYELVGESSALSLVCLFVPLVAGLWIPRANTTGALLSMSLGLVTWLAFLFFELTFPAILAGFFAGTLGMCLGIVAKKRGQ
jgi:Na+/proline symporter